MKKNDIIDIVSEKTSITKKDVERVYDAILETMVEALSKNEKVLLSGFGTFEVRDRASRSGLNPRTGETIMIPATKTPAFTAGKVLKDAVK